MKIVIQEKKRGLEISTKGDPLRMVAALLMTLNGIYDDQGPAGREMIRTAVMKFSKKYLNIDIKE